MTSPTIKSLELIRKQGYKAEVVEKWNPYARIRQDLFSFIDIVAIHEDKVGVLGIQTTSKKNIKARILKIKREPIAKIWLAAGNSIEVHGWEKKGMHYELSKEEVTVENIFFK